MEEALPGMVLGAPLTLSSNGIRRVSLPAAHTLTDDNLIQLARHGAEFMTIVEPDNRSDEQVAEDAAAAARRTLAIFKGADLSVPIMLALFDQVLGFRSE